MKKTLFLAAFLVTSCASSGILQTGKDTYMVSKRSPQAGFGEPVGAKTYVYEQANKHCGGMGRSVETVNLETQDSGFGRPGSATLEYRCIP